MRNLVQSLLQNLSRIVAITLAGGFLALALTRLAPGVDEREMDIRLSDESRASIRQSHEADRKIFHFYAKWLAGLLHGDLGMSQAMDRPVKELLRERLPVTMRLLGGGLAMGWVLGLGLALPLAFLRGRGYDFGASAFAALVVCIPAAVLALLFVLLRAPATLALGLLIFPKIFRYARTLLQQSASLPHVVTARAKGLGTIRVLVWHYFPPASRQWLALLAVSVTVGLSAAVPVEVVCDLPGIGQLAWKAALARDLYLLVCLTGIAALATVAAKAIADVLREATGVTGWQS